MLNERIEALLYRIIYLLINYLNYICIKIFIILIIFLVILFKASYLKFNFIL